MTAFLPPHLFVMFAPRPDVTPFPEKPPSASRKRRLRRAKKATQGLASYASLFENPATIDSSQFTYNEKKTEKAARLRREKAARVAEQIKVKVLEWKPSENPRIKGDAFATLIVARLSYTTTDEMLRTAFADYGRVVDAHVVRDREGKSRGYGFVEFETEKEMRRAYTESDARKIDGRRVLVDVERGRTVPTWLPRYLGGGAGFTRKGKKSENQTWAGRDPPRSMEHYAGGGGGGGGGGGAAHASASRDAPRGSYGPAAGPAGGYASAPPVPRGAPAYGVPPPSAYPSSRPRDDDRHRRDDRDRDRDRRGGERDRYERHERHERDRDRERHGSSRDRDRERDRERERHRRDDDDDGKDGESKKEDDARSKRHKDDEKSPESSRRHRHHKRSAGDGDASGDVNGEPPSDSTRSPKRARTSEPETTIVENAK